MRLKLARCRLRQRNFLFVFVIFVILMSEVDISKGITIEACDDDDSFRSVFANIGGGVQIVRTHSAFCLTGVSIAQPELKDESIDKGDGEAQYWCCT